MKYCQKCGNELDDDAVVCPKCGCTVSGSAGYYGMKKICAGFTLLGFLLPLLGLILYLAWKDEHPLKAKAAGKGALIGVIIAAVCSIIFPSAGIGGVGCPAAGIPGAM